MDLQRPLQFGSLAGPAMHQDHSASEVSGILELDDVWVFVQLIFGPHWPIDHLNKNSNIDNSRISDTSDNEPFQLEVILANVSANFYSVLAVKH